MTNPIALIVRFRVGTDSRTLLEEKLKDLFEVIQHEDTFLNATLHRDIEDPEQLLVYELWDESRESFLANQMPRSIETHSNRRLLISRWNGQDNGSSQLAHGIANGRRSLHNRSSTRTSVLPVGCSRHRSYCIQDTLRSGAS
jgi:hypothetical protein